MRTRAFLLVALLAGVAPGGGPVGASGPRHPAFVGTARFPLQAFEWVDLRCVATGEVVTGFDAEVLETDEGTSAGAGAEFGLHGSPLTVRAGSLVAHLGPEYRSEDGGYGVSFAFGNPGTVRMAVAIWADDAACAVTAGKVDVPLLEIDPERAVYLTPGDFTDGIGVDVYEFEGAGALFGYEREASGFLFAFLVNGAGITEARGPEGQDYSESGVVPFVLVAEPTDGLWQYSVPVSANIDPHLWIIETPI